MKSTRQPPSLLTAIISPASAFVLIALLELTNAVTPAGYPSANVLPPPYKRDSGELEDMEFRVAVDPGKTECFFQDAKKDHQLEVTYTVIDISSRFGWAAPHSRGDLIIDFTLKNPAGQIIETDRQKMEGSHVHTVTQEGTFEICLDNSFSSVSTKLVNVEVYLYSSDDEDRWGYFEENFTYPPEVQAMESIESIKASVNKVRDDLIRITHAQDERRAVERRDRNIVEQNFEHINRYSLFSIILLAVVGVVQVVLVRSLFEEKSAIKKIFKQFS